MIVSYYGGSLYTIGRGLFCTDCKSPFSVDIKKYACNLVPYSMVYCPYCGKGEFYPKDDMYQSCLNYNKYKEYINAR